MLKSRKILISLLIIILFINSITVINALDYNNYGVIVNNTFIDHSTKVTDFDGNIYIPLDQIQSNLNITINKTAQYIEILFNGNSLVVDLENNNHYLNQKNINLDFPILHRDNITYMPLIYIMDIMNYEIEILDDIQYIRILTAHTNVQLSGELIASYKDSIKAAEKKEMPVDKKEEEPDRIEPQNQKTTTKKKDNKDKVAYLTFDDGLDKNITPQILDILKQYEIKATFFIVGNTIEKNKDLLKRIIQEGHSVGNHTYTHKKEIIYNNVESFREELSKTSKLIYEVTKQEVKLFRPPYGGTYIKSDEYKDALKDYKTVLWNIDSKDSSSRSISSEEIVESVISQAKNKKSAIIIMHDSGTHIETVKALPQIIDYLKENGFTISAIKEDTTLYYEF